MAENNQYDSFFEDDEVAVEEAIIEPTTDELNKALDGTGAKAIPGLTRSEQLNELLENVDKPEVSQAAPSNPSTAQPSANQYDSFFEPEPSMQVDITRNKLTDDFVLHFAQNGYGEQFVDFTEALPGEKEAVQEFLKKRGLEHAFTDMGEDAFRIAPSFLQENAEIRKDISAEAAEAGYKRKNFFQKIGDLFKKREESVEAGANPEGLLAEEVLAMTHESGAKGPVRFNNVSENDYQRTHAFLEKHGCLEALHPQGGFEEAAKAGNKIVVDYSKLSPEAVKALETIQSINKKAAAQQKQASSQQPSTGKTQDFDPIKGKEQEIGANGEFKTTGLNSMAMGFTDWMRCKQPIYKPQEYTEVSEKDHKEMMGFLKKHNAEAAMSPQNFEDVEKSGGKLSINYSKIPPKARTELVQKVHDLDPKAYETYENRHGNYLTGQVMEARNKLWAKAMNNGEGMKPGNIAALGASALAMNLFVQPAAWLVDNLGITDVVRGVGDMIKDTGELIQEAGKGLANMTKNMAAAINSWANPEEKKATKELANTANEMLDTLRHKDPEAAKKYEAALGNFANSNYDGHKKANKGVTAPAISGTQNRSAQGQQI